MTIKRMRISSFDSADSNTSPVSSQSRLSNGKEELESDAITTDLSEQSVTSFAFEPAPSDASSSSWETVGTSVKDDESRDSERLHNTN